MTPGNRQSDQDAHDLRRDRPISRRRLLQATLAGTALGASGILSGWHSAGPLDVLAAPEPRRGGRLRVAQIGGGASETLDPNAGVSTIDASRAGNLFDRLARLGPKGTYELELAESFEPNANATEGTVRLRSGVTWHDGSPLT